MGTLIVIGGITPHLSLDKIDEEIIRLSNKKKPKVLYIPTAGGDDLDYCELFKGIYEGKFACKVDVLFLIRETPSYDEIRQKVFSADIVYIEGGYTSRLMDYFIRFNMDKILKEAYEKGIVVAGKSAGGICLGRYYFENEDARDFKIDGFSNYNEVECLKFMDLVVCPHYNLEGRAEKLDAMVKRYNLLGLGIDNDCAIEFIDNSFRIISTHESANAYKVYKDGARINKGIISKSIDFSDIDELMRTPRGST